MYQVEAVSNVGVRFHVFGYMLSGFLCVWERTWWPPAQTHHKNVTGGKLSQGEKCFGGLLYKGNFVLGGFYPRSFFDWSAYAPVVFVLGLFAGDF